MVNAVGKGVAQADLAYTAGFLDADGAIMASIEPHQEKRYGFRIRLVIKITQKDPAVLQWFANTFGVGQVVQNRTTYDWRIRSQGDVQAVITLLLPYLRTKQRQAVLAVQIATMDGTSREEFLRSAQLADTLARLNVRSNHRRRNFSSMVEATFSRND